MCDTNTYQICIIKLMVAVYDCDCDFVDEAHAERAVKGTFVHADHAAEAENRDYWVRMLMVGNAFDDDEGAVDDADDDADADDVCFEADVGAGADASRHCCCWCLLHRAFAVAVVVGRDVIYGDSVDSLFD